jgi:hypothetical protein
MPTVRLLGVPAQGHAAAGEESLAPPPQRLALRPPRRAGVGDDAVRPPQEVEAHELEVGRDPRALVLDRLAHALDEEPVAHPDELGDRLALDRAGGEAGILGGQHRRPLEADVEEGGIERFLDGVDPAQEEALGDLLADRVDVLDLEQPVLVEERAAHPEAGRFDDEPAHPGHRQPSPTRRATASTSGRPTTLL